MDISRKDNLTDLVERLPSTSAGNTNKPGSQQITNSEGEIVTLGQKPVNNSKRNSLELSDKDIKIIAQVFDTAIDKVVERLSVRNKQK